MIPMNQPFLPPESEYLTLVRSALKRNWLTNDGPLLNELELKLKHRFNLKHGIVVSNGTIALQIAIKALGLKGKVLTTPFSYIATASSLAWEGCTPVFVDIDHDHFNVTPEALESQLTEDVTGIVLTHCFGFPLDVVAIDALAAKAGIPVIYDGAHAFGSTVNGQSIFAFGDISTCSFHATKIFHMVEGGGIFAKDPDTLKKSSWMRNFGHNGPGVYAGIGINGKNSEMHAAMGLANLNHIDPVLSRRRQQCAHYNNLLSEEDSILLPDLNTPGWNCAYYPVVFESSQITEIIQTTLQQHEVFPRRYFWPSLNQVNGWGGECPNSEDISQRVLCLPLYHGLDSESQQYVTRLILRTLRYRR